jgi:ABC-type Fe3+/spermidine/putrescine transport system ATPase subunit
MAAAESVGVVRRPEGGGGIVIEVRRLCRSWGEFSLRDVSLRVDRGEYLVVLGPCGAGKTLLLETIAGLHVPISGSVLINGVDVTQVAPERRRVGFVYQQQFLFPHLSVLGNVGYGLRYLGLSRRQQDQRIAEMVELLNLRGIADRQSPAGLSGGEVQQVAVARALALWPRVLLLDEPLASLDFTTRGRVLDILRRVAERTQVPVIHVTHDQNEAATLASRIAVINDGSIVQDGSVEDVFWRPRSRFVAMFLGVENVIEGSASPPSNGLARISLGALALTAAYDGPAGPVTVCVRPEDLSVTVGGGHPATLKAASEDGFAVRMILGLREGPQLVARMTRTAFREMSPAVGSQVHVSILPAALHVIGPAKEGLNREV